MLIRPADEIRLTPDQVTKIRQEILADQTTSVDLLAKLPLARGWLTDSSAEPRVSSVLSGAERGG